MVSSLLFDSYSLQFKMSCDITGQIRFIPWYGYTVIKAFSALVIILKKVLGIA